MACTLHIGDRLVLLAQGPPEVEFALFDPGDSELQATEPGIVREIGYRTTAAEAKRRIELAGVTMSLAVDAAGAMISSLAARYSRGPAVRRIAPLLGPCELFEGKTYDGELRRYEGAWLDLPALALDVEISRATTLFQAFHLVALLSEVPNDATVVLDTREHSAERRPGERSFKRVPLDNAASLPTAIRALAAQRRTSPPAIRESGPTRTVLFEALRERALQSTDPQARERFQAIESALAIRERPSRGPLADPELWTLEEQLAAGNASGVLERIDTIEKRRGRHPATAYLRARAALLTGREPPSVVAERASALAMSMSSFAELELLAAEAWAAAGNLKRAAPFARDLIDTPGTHDELRARAVQILGAAEATGQLGSVPPPPNVVPAPPRSPIPAIPPVYRSAPPIAARSWPPVLDLSPAPHLEDNAIIGPAPVTRFQPDLTVNARSPSQRPPSSPVTPMPGSSGDSGRPGQPSRHPAEKIPAAPRTGFGTGLTAPPTADQASAPPRYSPMSVQPSASTYPRSPQLMRGASQPPFRADSPAAHVHIPKAPPLPRSLNAELAEHLTLPPGLKGDAPPPDAIPTSVIDARVQFTYLARELGLEYRTTYGVELRADISGIEAIQGRLLEHYPGLSLRTTQEAMDVRRHGAFLSEVLARSFGAFWVDIAPADLGYWAMVVPPDTRVWPFGRILRFIAMAHNERDLVAYYLELQSRADKI